jgi:hypothetical protein
MREFIWRVIARFVSRPRVAAYLIERSKRTPYLHLDGYMNRYWLFNPTPPQSNGQGRRFEWLPSIRIHHILRADHARDPHNHPWSFRTIILRGWYIERRDDRYHFRTNGETARLNADGFHHIADVGSGGVWTLFISWRWQHTWGFRTPEGFVPWRDYPDTNP